MAGVQGMSYSNDLYGPEGEEHEDFYHEDDAGHAASPTTAFSVSSSLYMPLSAREPSKIPTRSLSRLGTPRSLAQQTYIWQDNELARPSTASPVRRSSFATKQMPESPSQTHPEAMLYAQEQGMYQPQHKPRASHDMLATYAAPNGPITYVTEEMLYQNGPGMSRSEAMGASQESSYQRCRISDDAESEAPSPDSLASSPRSCASTPRSATSRPATPRERVQHQIALNQQKRRMRRQSSMTATMERVQPYETPRASSDPAPNNQTAAASWPAMPDATIKSLSNKPSPSQALAVKVPGSPGVSLHAQGLALVYDPELENPSSADRTPRKDPALRRASLSFYADMSDMRAFLAQPGPATGPLQCFIVRSRGAAKLYPRYSLYLDVGHKFLMAARKRKKARASNYVMSLDEKDLQRNSGSACGMVQSNYIGTEFTIYDQGMSGVTALSPKDVHSEVAAVRYDVNVLGTKGPRKMTAIVPAVDAESGRPVARAPSIHADSSIIERHKRGHSRQDMVVMHNKPPRWNEQLSAYCLNFKGRVTQASVKNFQLVSEADPELVLLQFGKVGDDMFTMDYQWPLSAVQAFGIALSSFDSKLACE